MTQERLDGYTNNEGLRWYRMPRESRQAYEAFTVYRDLGPGRTLKAVAQKLGKNISLMKSWSAKWEWVDRADSFDKDEEVTRMWDMRARRVQWLEKDLQITDEMMNKIIEALKQRDPDSLSNNQLIRWYDVLSRRQEKILGITPEQMEEQLASQASQESELEKLLEESEDMRDAYLDLIQRRDSATDAG